LHYQKIKKIASEDKENFLLHGLHIGSGARPFCHKTSKEKSHDQ
jgi:hypothetical protein